MKPCFHFLVQHQKWFKFPIWSWCAFPAHIHFMETLPFPVPDHENGSMIPLSAPKIRVLRHQEENNDKPQVPNTVPHCSSCPSTHISLYLVPIDHIQSAICTPKVPKHSSCNQTPHRGQWLKPMLFVTPICISPTKKATHNTHYQLPQVSMPSYSTIPCLAQPPGNGRGSGVWIGVHYIAFCFVSLLPLPDINFQASGHVFCHFLLSERPVGSSIWPFVDQPLTLECSLLLHRIVLEIAHILIPRSILL